MSMLVRPALGPRLMAIAVTMILAIAACSGSSATPSPTNAPAATPASAEGTPATTAGTTPEATTAEATEARTDDGGQAGAGDLSGATANLSNITSYKFSMSMKGGSVGDLLGGQPMKGTVVIKPTKAVQMSFMGMEFVEIDGKTWVKMGDSWVSGDSGSSASMADSFAPEKMFGSTLSGTAVDGYRAAGDEQKNGTATVHYVADASMLNEYASLFGVDNATNWSAEVWIAKDGGYPVSMAVTASGGTEAFEMTFDITNVNDPGNEVETPA